MQVPEDLRYSREHEWVRLEGDGTARVGITDYAQSELGDVVYVELPEVGRHLRAGEALGVVESVKSVSDIYCPVSGRVAEVNGALTASPEKVNQDPYGEGWMVRLEPDDPAEAESLLDAAGYRALIGAEGGA
ncbi:MAG: glycine cleavage system protein GcvH [Clostridia bacterium]|nr:glycine cleavage system protein GcvH [Clostridia bacterium]